jgi:hypothetical protein
VKRKHRHLDRKAKRKCDEQENLKCPHFQNAADCRHVKDIESPGTVCKTRLKRLPRHLCSGVVAGEGRKSLQRHLARVGSVLCEEVHLQHAEQHHDRTNERVKKELNCRVETILATPDTDQEVHRHERHFEEQVKQKHVHRTKHADHRRL